MRQALLVTFSNTRYFRQIKVDPKNFMWLALLVCVLITSFLVANPLSIWFWQKQRQQQVENTLLKTERQQLLGELRAVNASLKALELPLAGYYPKPISRLADLPSIAAENLVSLQNSNREHQFTIIALEKRVHALTYDQLLLGAELQSLEADKQKLLPAWQTLQAVMGEQVPLSDSSHIELLLGEVWHKLEAMAEVPSGWPFGGPQRVTSKFGFRIHPIDKTRKKHLGIDLSCRNGEPILATAPGIVSESHYSKSFGYQVTVTHNYGFRSRYAHLQKRKSKVGEWVGKGDPIGLCGQSGSANGPHLHYEVRYLAKALDPFGFISWELSTFDELITTTGSTIPWQSLLRQIASKPRQVSTAMTALP